MTDFHKSSFRVATVGLVAADKPLRSRFIEVYPMEMLPFYEGKITDDIVNIDKTGEESDGAEYTVKLKKSMTVKAEWIGAANRRTSPNVKKNEQVRLWTVGDSDKYWWEPLNRDDHLRTKEVVTWAWAARSVGGGPLTANDSYSLTVDTINRHMTLQTSGALGEKAKYVLQVNGGEGNVSITDDQNNLIQMNSVERKILFRNADKSYFAIDKKDFIGYAPENCKFTFDGDYSLHVGKNYYLVCSGDVEESIDGNSTDWTGGSKITQVIGNYNVEAENLLVDTIGTMSLIAGAGMTLSSPTLKLMSAAPIIIDSPLLQANGSMSVMGSLAVAGSTTVIGNISINGTTLIGGAAVVGGTFSVAGVSTFAGLATFVAGIITPTINGIVPGANNGSSI